jgi:3-deoxy-D-manno-octulosonic-acid transferase
LLSRISAIVSQTDQTAEALISLGADPARVSVSGDLKAASARLPLDLAALDEIETQTAGRNIWVAASTHPGEEELVVAAHSPDQLLVLVPRHPERGDEIADLLRNGGWTVAQRSKQDPLLPETQIYLADTLGEMGIWYALAPTVFLGGSLVDVGGHNPFEPAQFSAAVLTGPHVTNFRESYDQMFAAGAARMVREPEALRSALDELREGPVLAAMQQAAHAFVGERTAIRDHVADRLEPLLSGGEK